MPSELSFLVGMLYGAVLGSVAVLRGLRRV